MPFRLCNSPATFQRCMMAIFHDMLEDFMEVFMDDFSIFGNSFDCCLANLDRMLARCEETNLVLNCEKCHFMVKEGIVLGHKISGADASDFVVGAVLGQRVDGKFKPIYYASKTLNNAQEHYTTIEKELLTVDAKRRLIRWVLLLQGFDIEIKDKRGEENLVAYHLSRLENTELSTFTEEEITDEFPDQHLMALKTKINNDEPWGHHSASVTGRKVYESGFFWPSIFKDTKDYVIRYDACQRSGNISSRSEMPQNNI
ncbi:reverse transcriptase domain-containing protein [Tanacetum coccineum]